MFAAIYFAQMYFAGLPVYAVVPPPPPPPPPPTPPIVYAYDCRFAIGQVIGNDNPSAPPGSVGQSGPTARLSLAGQTNPCAAVAGVGTKGPTARLSVTGNRNRTARPPSIGSSGGPTSGSCP